MTQTAHRDANGDLWLFEQETGSAGGLEKRPVVGLPSTVVSDIAAIKSAVDGLEALVGTTNSTLSTIDSHIDGLEALIGTTNSTLSTIDGRVDGLEALIGTTNSTLSTIDGRVDGLEAKLDTLAPTSIGTPYQKSTGGTETQLNSVECTLYCVIKNISTTSQVVYVGKTGIATSTGFQLTVGESERFPCRNTNELYIIASASSANVSVLPC